MRKSDPQPHTRARAGESMVMVVVMLLVFFVLGGSVLTAASATSAAASARITERQCYYYARSMLDVLDESLREGELGRVLKNRIMEMLVDAGEEGAVTLTSESNGRPTPLMTLTPSFAGALEGILFDEPVAILCDGRAAASKGTGAGITEATIQLRKLDMTFTLLFRGIPTRMHVQYGCTWNVTDYDAAAGTGTWSGTWNIQQVG